MVVLIRLSLFYTNGMVNEYVRILWTIPLFVFMIFILNEESKVAGFFSSKFLIFLGTVSYSIYLCHTSIVDGLHLIFKPGDLAGNIVFIFLSFGLTLAVATSLYYLLERPYFIKKASQAGLPDQRPHQYYPVLSFSIIILLFLSLFIAYQSNYNFFSYEKSFGRDVIQSPSAKGETDRISVLKSKEINIRLLSPQDNLGIVTASLSHISPPGSLAAPPELVFQIKPAASKDWLSTATYSLAEIGESKLHPFGFPVIKQAKNKEFDIRIYLTESKSLEDIYINVTNGVVFKTVNQLDKKQFISNPFKLIPMIANRVDNTFENREARIVFFSLLPFLVLTILLNKRQSRRLTKSE